MDLYKSVKEGGLSAERLKCTAYFYYRLLTYVIVLYCIVLVYKIYVPVAQVVAVNPVITYSMLLALLCYLYIYKPDKYVKFKDWCAPGNGFLRFWINMNIFTYLTQIPVVLEPFSAIEAFSWFVQCTFISPIALILNAYIVSGFIYVARYIYKVEEEKTLIVESTSEESSDGASRASIGSTSRGSLARVSMFHSSSARRKSARLTLANPKGISNTPRGVQSAISSKSRASAPDKSFDLDDTMVDETEAEVYVSVKANTRQSMR